MAQIYRMFCFTFNFHIEWQILTYFICMAPYAAVCSKSFAYLYCMGVVSGYKQLICLSESLQIARH